MKPAAPVTSSFMPPASCSVRAGRGRRRGRAARAAARSRARAGCQGRVGGAAPGGRAFLGGRREHLHSTLACSKISRAKSYQEQCAAGGHVVDAELDSLDQSDDPVGEMPGVGRRADLVADDEDLVAAAGQARLGRRSAWPAFVRCNSPPDSVSEPAGQGQVAQAHLLRGTASSRKSPGRGAGRPDPGPARRSAASNHRLTSSIAVDEIWSIDRLWNRTARASGFRRLPRQAGQGAGSDSESAGLIAPSPWQIGQAPCGLLNENERGSGGCRPVPQSGQARWTLRTWSSQPPAASAETRAIPSDNLSARSTLSASRGRMPSRITSRSTTASM